jgi:hypothetical protein
VSDRPSVLERLGAAYGSSDLSFDPNHRNDLDFITAAGIAASRHLKVASPVMRVHYANSPADLNSAFRAVISLVRRFNAKRNWRLNGKSMQVVALHALSHHVDPVCSHCHGRKFELLEGTPALSTKPCRHCHGTGRRQIQKKHREQIGHVIAALETIDEITERAVARLVR